MFHKRYLGREAARGACRTSARRAFAAAPCSPPWASRTPTTGRSSRGSRPGGGLTIRSAGSDQVVEVLIEPNAGTNGIVAADNFWPELRALTRKLEVYLIADEVVSGFGRCGEWFAWQVYGEAGQPDLMTLAKGLTGAHAPLGAVVLSQVVAEHLEHEMLSTGLTYCGHPLACAADRGHRGLSGRAIDRTFKNAGRVHAEAIARS